MYLKDVINSIDHADLKQISQIDITNWYSAMYISLTVKKMKKKAAKRIYKELRQLGYQELCEIPVERYSLCKIYDKHDILELAKLTITMVNDDRLYKYRLKGHFINTGLKGTVEYVAGLEGIKMENLKE